MNTWFNIIGENGKCVKNMTPNFQLNFQREDECMKFYPNSKNQLISQSKCVTNELKLGTENCLYTDYYPEGIIRNDQLCFDSATGKQRMCNLTPDYYMRLSYRSDTQ